MRVAQILFDVFWQLSTRKQFSQLTLDESHSQKHDASHTMNVIFCLQLHNGTVGRHVTNKKREWSTLLMHGLHYILYDVIDY